jgi:TetR/AcrR family transcriptional regulator, regulator of biofilm formation and stress response
MTRDDRSVRERVPAGDDHPTDDPQPPADRDRGQQPSSRPARRYDPDRASRIVDATIDVIAEHGVAGTTHRLIAAAADVPLGSLTYHFSGLDDLLSCAFTRHAERMAVDYEARFAGVGSTDDLVEAVTGLVHADADADERDWAVAYELFLAALRNPALRTVTESWMRRSRGVLERFVDPTTSRGIDALIEGLVMHKVLSTEPVSREQTREIVARALRPTDTPTTSSEDPA